MHVVWAAQRLRGGVGQGLLTDSRFADAGLDRRDGALWLAGVLLVVALGVLPTAWAVMRPLEQRFGFPRQLERVDGIVVLAGSGDAVAAVLRLANEHRVPIVPWGGGSGSQGGAVLSEGGLHEGGNLP